MSNDVLELLLNHPLVVSAEEIPPEKLGMPGLIEVKFANGEGGNLRRDLLERRHDETEDERRERVTKTLTQLGTNAPIESVDVDQAVPLVRSADYFMTEKDTASFLWQPLTDCIGMGLAVVAPDRLRIVGGSELPNDRSAENVERVRLRACQNLKDMAEKQLLAALDFAPDVLAITTPAPCETAWFANTEVLADMLAHLERQSGTPWVVIPKSRRDILVVNSATEAWELLLEWLESCLEDRETVHIAPHVLGGGKWREHIPSVAPDTKRRIRELALRSRWRMQSGITNILRARGNDSYDFVSPFSAYEHEGRFVTVAPASVEMNFTSIPEVERIGFLFGENDVVEVAFKDMAARLPHLFAPHPGVFPRRWVLSKPSDADLKVLRELAI